MPGATRATSSRRAGGPCGELQERPATWVPVPVFLLRKQGVELDNKVPSQLSKWHDPHLPHRAVEKVKEMKCARTLKRGRCSIVLRCDYEERSNPGKSV